MCQSSKCEDHTKKCLKENRRIFSRPKIYIDFSKNLFYIQVIINYLGIFTVFLFLFYLVSIATPLKETTTIIWNIPVTPTPTSYCSSAILRHILYLHKSRSNPLQNINQITPKHSCVISSHLEQNSKSSLQPDLSTAQSPPPQLRSRRSSQRAADLTLATDSCCPHGTKHMPVSGAFLCVYYI